ncbi:MAG: RNA polymerase sigma factor [bacterium]|nr:RNA polymerase sigma factor [bacterium]
MVDRAQEDKRLTELMTSYQKGSMDDFAELYSIMEKPLRRFLWSFVRNSSAAEDLLQETFLQVHRARHTYTPPRPPRPWLYAISRHVALMHLRSNRHRKEDLAHEDLPEIPVSPEIDQIADRTTVKKYLTRLPQASQEVLILHHLMGLSFEEVGAVVGASAGTAKVRAHRALNTLREKLYKEGLLKS